MGWLQKGTCSTHRGCRQALSARAHAAGVRQHRALRMLLVIRRASSLGGKQAVLKKVLKVLEFSLNKDTEPHCDSDYVQVMWV